MEPASDYSYISNGVFIPDFWTINKRWYQFLTQPQHPQHSKALYVLLLQLQGRQFREKTMDRHPKYLKNVRPSQGGA